MSTVTYSMSESVKLFNSGTYPEQSDGSSCRRTCGLKIPESQDGCFSVGKPH